MTTDLSHEFLNQLIPWYVNETLSAEESDRLEQHLKSCVACRSEVEWMREVGAVTTHMADEPLPVQPSFDKAMVAVERWEKSKEPSRIARLASWKTIWNPSVQIARYAMAAQFVLIAGLCIALWVSHHAVNSRYTTLSGSEPANPGGIRLTISFAPGATMEQVREILGEINGNIVDGPSANGICIVQLPTPADKDAEVDAAIQKLHQNKAVRFVERLP